MDDGQRSSPRGRGKSTAASPSGSAGTSRRHQTRSEVRANGRTLAGTSSGQFIDDTTADLVGVLSSSIGQPSRSTGNGRRTSGNKGSTMNNQDQSPRATERGGDDGSISSGRGRSTSNQSSQKSSLDRGSGRGGRRSASGQDQNQGRNESRQGRGRGRGGRGGGGDGQGGNESEEGNQGDDEQSIIGDSIRECIIPNNDIKGGRLSDLFGLEEIKTVIRGQILLTLTLPLERPDLFDDGQAQQPPKSILLYGPPGTGKTAIAKVIAGEMIRILARQETSLTFFKVKSSKLLGSYHSQSEKGVTALFDEIMNRAEEGAVIVFMDEVDALVMKSGSGHESQCERRVLDLFKDEWNRIIDSDRMILVIGATNHKDHIDDAILSRFEGKYEVPQLDEAVRERIIKKGLQKVRHDISDEQFKLLARRTDGLCGRALKTICTFTCRRPQSELVLPDSHYDSDSDNDRFADVTREDLIVTFRHADEEVTRVLAANTVRADNKSSKGQANEFLFDQILQEKHRLGEEVETLRSELAVLKSSKQQNETRLAELESENRRLITAKKGIEAHTAELEKSQENDSEQIKQLSVDKAILEGRIEENEEKADACISELKSSINELHESVVTLTQEKANATASSDRLRSKVAAQQASKKQDKARIAELESESTKWKKEKEGADARTSELNKRLGALTEEKNVAVTRSNKLEAKSNGLQQSVHSLQAKISAEEQKSESVNAEAVRELKASRARIKKLETELESLKDATEDSGILYPDEPNNVAPSTIDTGINTEISDVHNSNGDDDNGGDVGLNDNANDDNVYAFPGDSGDDINPAEELIDGGDASEKRSAGKNIDSSKDEDEDENENDDEALPGDSRDDANPAEESVKKAAAETTVSEEGPSQKTADAKFATVRRKGGGKDSPRVTRSRSSGSTGSTNQIPSSELLPPRASHQSRSARTKKTSSAEQPRPDELSDYERTRAQNVERNNARVRKLCLISKEEEERSNDIAWKRRDYEAEASSEGSDANSEDEDESEYEPEGDDKEEIEYDNEAEKDLPSAAVASAAAASTSDLPAGNSNANANSKEMHKDEVETEAKGKDKKRKGRYDSNTAPIPPTNQTKRIRGRRSEGSKGASIKRRSSRLQGTNRSSTSEGSNMTSNQLAATAESGTRGSNGRKLCRREGCDKLPRSGGLAGTHGGGKRCKVEGCDKLPRSGGLAGYCVTHGGGKRCKVEGCDKLPRSGGLAGYCFTHGGGKRCKVEGCDKSAQSGGLDGCCKAHGGGKRCKQEGCDKSAKNGGLEGCCIAHGGGKRCKVEDCNKSAQSGGLDGCCKAHGGGKRCKVEGCDKSAQSGGLDGYCATHGGGQRCMVEGCDKHARNGCRGRCKAHSNQGW